MGQFEFHSLFPCIQPEADSSWVMPKRSSTSDPVLLAKRVFDQIESRDKPPKNPAAVKLGGPKGGPARAEALTPERRSEIARKAAVTRWKSRRSSYLSIP